ncbi:MAG: UTP--glucose-1-phosphate uridylyltransferase [Acidimicrobiia bacterium]|nr:UTP--glucose-1-phosphate uridylyltransferase [Acidimicrobiia bacterium]
MASTERRDRSRAGRAAATSRRPARRLGSRYYGRFDDFAARFNRGVPSLVDCERFVVRGDVRFGADVTLRGIVTLENRDDQPVFLPDGTVLDNHSPPGLDLITEDT